MSNELRAADLDVQFMLQQGHSRVINLLAGRGEPMAVNYACAASCRGVGRKYTTDTCALVAKFHDHSLAPRSGVTNLLEVVSLHIETVTRQDSAGIKEASKATTQLTITSHDDNDGGKLTVRRITDFVIETTKSDRRRSVAKRSNGMSTHYSVVSLTELEAALSEVQQLIVEALA